MDASPWHWVSLVFVVVGTALIVIGAARTSFANGGRVARAWARLPRRRRHVRLNADAGVMSIATDGDISVIAGFPEEGSDAEKIDWLRDELARVTKISGDALLSIARDVSVERRERQEAMAGIDGGLEDLRIETLSGLRRTALDGLLLAVLGAVLVGAGDVIGAALALCEASIPR